MNDETRRERAARVAVLQARASARHEMRTRALRRIAAAAPFGGRKSTTLKKWEDRARSLDARDARGTMRAMSRIIEGVGRLNQRHDLSPDQYAFARHKLEAGDPGWDEALHPRDPDGKWTNK